MEGRIEVRMLGKMEGRIEGRMEGKMEGRMLGKMQGRIDGRIEGRMEGTVQPKNNARARSGTRSSCAARTRKPLQDVKMSCFFGLPTRTFEMLEVEGLAHFALLQHCGLGLW